MSTALSVGYSGWARDLVCRRIQSERPDIAHIHNIFPLLTASVYYVCQELSIPVIQTLHNYRLGCIAGTLFRDGAICEKCWSGSPLWGIAHRCYRGSLLGSTAAAIAQLSNRRAFSPQPRVSRFIAVSNFAKEKFVAFGVPEQRIVVKPNFVAEVPDTERSKKREGALFVGRLSPEKGILDLVKAWREIDYPLTIVGEGPLEGELRSVASTRVKFVGRLGAAEVHALMRRSSILVFPSKWYETFGMVIIEAFACGLPVLASSIGAPRELLASGEGGWLYPADSTSALPELVRGILANSAELENRRISARSLFEKEFSPAANYERLISIYASALSER